MGVGSERHRENRPDDDDGAGHQRRREQVRHVGAQLRGARRHPRAHPAGRPVRMRHPAQDHEQVPESAQLWTVGLGRVLRLLPGTFQPSTVSTVLLVSPISPVQWSVQSFFMKEFG